MGETSYTRETLYSMLIITMNPGVKIHVTECMSIGTHLCSGLDGYDVRQSRISVCGRVKLNHRDVAGVFNYVRLSPQLRASQVMSGVN